MNDRAEGWPSIRLALARVTLAWERLWPAVWPSATYTSAGSSSAVVRVVHGFSDFSARGPMRPRCRSIAPRLRIVACTMRNDGRLVPYRRHSS